MAGEDLPEHRGGIEMSDYDEGIARLEANWLKYPHLREWQPDVRQEHLRRRLAKWQPDSLAEMHLPELSGELLRIHAAITSADGRVKLPNGRKSRPYDGGIVQFVDAVSARVRRYCRAELPPATHAYASLRAGIVAYTKLLDGVRDEINQKLRTIYAGESK